MKQLIVIVIFFNAFIGESQSHVNDPESSLIQSYDTSQISYVFQFGVKSQGLIWKNIRYDKRPYLEIHVVNNFNNTIINNYRERDSRIYWLRKNGNYTRIPPGEEMIIRSAWTDAEPKGTFSSPIRLNYQIGDSTFTNEIKIWGSLFPNDQRLEPPNIKKQVNRLDSLPIFIYSLDTTPALLLNNDVSIVCYNLNSPDSILSTLDFEDEKKLFFDGKSDEWVELIISDRKGSSFRRTMYLPLYYRTEYKPYLYIGNYEYLNFSQGILMPYQAVFDLIYIWSDYSSIRKNYKLKLLDMGLKPENINFPALYKLPEDVPRNKLIEELIQIDSIRIAPIHTYDNDNHVYGYWSDRIEILTNPNLTEEKLNELLDSIGISEVKSIRPYSILKDYSSCNAFRIEFSKTDMLSYNFLIKLKQLHNLKPIYKIFTNSITGVYRYEY